MSNSKSAYEQLANRGNTIDYQKVVDYYVENQGMIGVKAQALLAGGSNSTGNGLKVEATKFFQDPMVEEAVRELAGKRYGDLTVLAVSQLDKLLMDDKVSASIKKDIALAILKDTKIQQPSKADTREKETKDELIARLTKLTSGRRDVKPLDGGGSVRDGGSDPEAGSEQIH